MVNSHSFPPGEQLQTSLNINLIYTALNSCGRVVVKNKMAGRVRCPISNQNPRSQQDLIFWNASGEI